MVGDQPSDFGEASGNRAPAEQWAPRQAAPTPLRARTWPAVALAAIAVGVAVAALIVALTKSTHAAPAATKMPAYTAADTATAQRQLCDTYKLVAHAAQIDTAGSDKALARISLTNGALMLDDAAANPALDASQRDVARALAMAYETLTAKGTYGLVNDAEYQAALEDANAKDAAMKKVCGGS